jgi:uncharacterized membrane protein
VEASGPLRRNLWSSATVSASATVRTRLGLNTIAPPFSTREFPLILDLLPLLDVLALCWFVGIIAAYEFVATRPAIYQKSIASYVQNHRRDWMIEMSKRDNRIVDGQLLGWLVNANAFFASTTVIVIGGLAALLSYGEKAREIVAALPYADNSTATLWEIKVIFLMMIMIYAFFKFAWAFRLSHYTVMMMGATPAHDAPDAAARIDHANRTAELLGLVGWHSNLGLRSFYYTIAGLMWFFHPIAFIIAASWVVLILTRRDFFSHSRDILKGPEPQA